MLVAPRHSPGHLAENVMHFARVLRSAGMPLGTDRVQLALQALKIAGFDSRSDFHAVLSTCMLDRIEHKDLFDQAFDLFWRDPDLEGRMRAMLLPKVRAQQALTPEQRENRRLGDALFPNPKSDVQQPQPDESMEFDAALTVSDTEVLRKADFDTMSADEWRAARRALALMRWVFEPLPTRRVERSPRAGRVDWRATLQTMARHGGELGEMRWRRPRPLPAPMVVLADISGSMSRYSRMLLHFAHALGHAEARVESFVFGTRLTRTTRLLKSRDPDVAVSQVVKAVEDWSGGTRITTSLHEFNQRWARRCLSSRTTVLLISDGLEHGDTRVLSREMERLAKSCRRLIWLNPLLRFEKFQPRAAGIRAMLPYVDRFLPVHNLDSLEHLVRLLGNPDAPARSRQPVVIESPPCN